MGFLLIFVPSTSVHITALCHDTSTAISFAQRTGARACSPQPGTVRTDSSIDSIPLRVPLFLDETSTNSYISCCPRRCVDCCCFAHEPFDRSTNDTAVLPVQLSSISPIAQETRRSSVSPLMYCESTPSETDIPDVMRITCLKKNQNAPRPEHPPVKGKKCQNV